VTNLHGAPPESEINPARSSAWADDEFPALTLGGPTVEIIWKCADCSTCPALTKPRCGSGAPASWEAVMGIRAGLPRPSGAVADPQATRPVSANGRAHRPRATKFTEEVSSHRRERFVARINSNEEICCEFPPIRAEAERCAADR
jgi:hypothetical protein